MAENGQRLGIGAGCRGFLGGIGFILSTPSTWPYAAVPVLTALILMCGIGALATWAAWYVPTLLISDDSDLSTTARWLVTVSAALAAWIAAIFLGLALAQPFSGWALEVICVKYEFALTGQERPAPPLLTSLWISIRCTLFILIVGAIVIGALFVVGLLFPPAAIVTVPLKFLCTGWLLAWDFVDYPLGLRGMGIRPRAAWAYRNKWALTAFGLLWTAVLLIPLVALFVLPLGVAGAARLVVEAEWETVAADPQVVTQFPPA